MRRTFVMLCLFCLLAGCTSGNQTRAAGKPGVIRLGYLANLTQAQAILGVADGSLARSAGARIETKVFPAGPAAITALLAGEIDLLYVGPSPAVTGYVRSEGRALRIIAGGASGGAVFVTRQGFDPTHLDGAHLATPGFANTQDVALRTELARRGLRTREQGGSVQVNAMAPADILLMFARGELDGAWVAEPWGARIQKETDARLAWDERSLWPDGRLATTVLVASTPYLETQRETVRGFLAGHVALTRWIQDHPDEARARLSQGLAKMQGKPLPDDVMIPAFSRVDFTDDPMIQSVLAQAERAYRLGFLGARQPDLTNLYDLSLLKEVAP